MGVKCIINDEAYYEQSNFYHSTEFNVFLCNRHFKFVHLVYFVSNRVLICLGLFPLRDKLNNSFGIFIANQKVNYE